MLLSILTYPPIAWWAQESSAGHTRESGIRAPLAALAVSQTMPGSATWTTRSNNSDLRPRILTTQQVGLICAFSCCDPTTLILQQRVFANDSPERFLRNCSYSRAILLYGKYRWTRNQDQATSKTQLVSIGPDTVQATNNMRILINLSLVVFPPPEKFSKYRET
jgi:hypothetical protein